MATAAQRQHMAALMDLLLAHASQYDYPPQDHRGPLDAATFRMTEQTLEHVLRSGGRLMADCSEDVTEICRMAGLADPNGLGYRYAGYTGTILHLPHYTDAKLAAIGALVVFGGGTGHHVAMVRKPDPKNGNPLLHSHGRPGVDRITLRDEMKRQPPGVTFCSIAHL